MPLRWKQVEQWRWRAEEIRTVADGFSVPSVKEAMLALAQSYDRKADTLASQLLRQAVTNPQEC